MGLNDSASCFSRKLMKDSVAFCGWSRAVDFHEIVGEVLFAKAKVTLYKQLCTSKT